MAVTPAVVTFGDFITSQAGSQAPVYSSWPVVEGQREGTPECREPGACSVLTDHSDASQVVEIGKGPAGPLAGNLGVTDVRPGALDEETELYSVLAETAALTENGVSAYPEGRIAFPSFKNDIHIPQELRQLLDLARSESWPMEREFPLLDARLLYRMDPSMGKALLFAGRCSVGGRYIAVEIKRVSVSGGRRTVWCSPQDIRNWTQLGLTFVLPAEIPVVRGFPDKPRSGDRAILTCLEAGERPVLSPLPTEQLPAFRKDAFKVKVQVLSTHVTVSHRRGSPIFITRLAVHEPVNGVPPLFQSITGSETFTFIASSNSNNHSVAAVARDLLKRRPVCVLERSRERAPLTLTCDTLKEMDGYTDMRDFFQKRRDLKREQKLTRVLSCAAALLYLGLILQGLRWNRDDRIPNLMTTTISNSLEQRGISSPTALGMADAVHPSNLHRAFWFLRHPVSNEFGPEWRRGLFGYFLKGVASWFLAVTAAVHVAGEVDFFFRKRELRVLEERRKDARVRKMKNRKQSATKSVTLLLLVDGPLRSPT